MATDSKRQSKNDKILEQCLLEIEFARKHRQLVVEQNWSKNENMYYGKKPRRVDELSTKVENHRSRVMLPKGQGFVDTLLSKVDAPPAISYEPGEESDKTKVQNLDALLRQDSKPALGNWDFKDLLGKKQAIVYGRAIHEYHAESKPSYRSVFSNVDVYDFLIDPSTGGLDIEDANYLGRGNIFKSKHQLKAGIKDKKYSKTATNALLASGGDAESDDVEKQQKANRYVALKTEKTRVRDDKNIFKLWEWYTTYEGERYYLLLSEKHNKAIRVEKLKDVFKSELWPFISWATNPDIAEFWTPSPLDGVREIFMAQIVSINQMIDNADQRNNPLKLYSVDAIKSPGLLKWRRDGLTPVAKKADLNSAVKVLEVPEINTPAQVYNILEGIAAVESGITPDAKGVSDEERVGILESNIAQVADRLGLLNRSYANAYHRLGLLYYHGIKEHLSGTVAIQMLGINGIEYKKIKKADTLSSGADFDVVVSASGAEEQVNIREQRTKITFLSSYKGAPTINQDKLFETTAETIGIEKDIIRQLLDRDNMSDSKIMEEAARDIKAIIEDKEITLNDRADVGYLQKFVDYFRDHQEDMEPKIVARYAGYMESLQPVIVRNMVQKANKQLAIEARQNPQQPGATPPGRPPVPNDAGAATGTPADLELEE